MSTEIKVESLSTGRAAMPLRVNDLKQFEYCPRIVFYNTVMPVERKTTVKMDRGQQEELRLDALESRRTLRRYQLAEGERRFHVTLKSDQLALSGKLDLLIFSPKGIFPVDFKYTRGRPRRNHIIQLAAYALLIEEAFETRVTTGFLYLTPLQQVIAIPLTATLKDEVLQRLAEIRVMIHDGLLPPPTPFRARCEECEFRNFCGDVF